MSSRDLKIARQPGAPGSACAELPRLGRLSREQRGSRIQLAIAQQKLGLEHTRRPTALAAWLAARAGRARQLERLFGLSITERSHRGAERLGAIGVRTATGIHHDA